MEEIIGLLVALAAIIFKVVGKKLEKSAVPGTGNTEDSHEESAGNPFDVKKWLEEVVAEVKDETESEPVPVREIPEPMQPVEEGSRSVVKVAAVAKKPVNKPVKSAVTEDKPKVGEKIDPKKLVVYSEIMKPKYLEEN